LQGAGCDEFQGFLYAPALDSLSFEKHMPAPTVTPPRQPAARPQPFPRMRLVR
jgi:EAL domain-containing protein (putative c-di-GMP-specific phosphodiesterase class I)